LEIKGTAPAHARKSDGRRRSIGDLWLRQEKRC
jgi:hypothetical protein